MGQTLAILVYYASRGTLLSNMRFLPSLGEYILHVIILYKKLNSLQDIQISNLSPTVFNERSGGGNIILQKKLSGIIRKWQQHVFAAITPTSLLCWFPIKGIQSRKVGSTTSTLHYACFSNLDVKECFDKTSPVHCDEVIND